MYAKCLIPIIVLFLNSSNLSATQNKNYERLDEYQININALDVDVSSKDFERLDEHQIQLHAQMADIEEDDDDDDDDDDDYERIDESTINSQMLDKDTQKEYERLDEFEINEELEEGESIKLG